jgi:hypothetical protein
LNDSAPHELRRSEAATESNWQDFLLFVIAQIAAVKSLRRRPF